MNRKPNMLKDVRSRITEVRRVRASDLQPHPGNWRQHGEAQVSAMAGVMQEVGDVGVLLAWISEREGGKLTLIDGHLRAGIAPDHEYMVAVTDLTDAEADYVLATHDPLAAMASADAAALDALLSSVSTGDDAVKRMMDDLAKDAGIFHEDEGADAEPQIDRAEELRIKWGVELGQLWQLGEHRLVCGDCTKAEDVARCLDGAKPLLCVTDPPYGVEYDANWRNEADRANGKPYGDRAIGNVANDDRADWRAAWALFPGDVIYSWHPPGATSLVHAAALQDSGFKIRMQIIWAKNQFPIGRGDYHVKHEPCWYCVREGKAAHFTDDRTQTTLWEIDKPHKSETGHSTQKPVECMARPIRNHDSEYVYEPFCGSGTTLIACENLGRKCRAVEISPGYCAVILQRWADATGKTPTLVS